MRLSPAASVTAVASSVSVMAMLGSSTDILNPLLVSEAVMPPPTLVPLWDTPRTMLTTSVDSAILSGVTLNTRPALRAPAPLKRSFGVAVSASCRVMPGLLKVDERYRSQSPVVTFVPPMRRDISITSSATNSRPRDT